jgi:hypothetical protein
VVNGGWNGVLLGERQGSKTIAIVIRKAKDSDGEH